MNGEKESVRSEFIGYMKRAIEDMGEINNRFEKRMATFEKRMERLEGRINNIEIKIATAMGGVIVIWYFAKELIKKHVRIF